MNAAIQKFLDFISQVEGANLDMTYSDPGNWTGGKVGSGSLRGSKCGISAASYPTLDISTLTTDQIAFIYQTDYLDKISFSSLPVPIAIITGDCAVNQGVSVAAKFLQTALGVDVDGGIGPKTIAAATKYDDNPAPIVCEIAALRMVRYASLGTFTTFGLGWARRLMSALNFALGA